MITHLDGVLTAKVPPVLVVDVHGVGYEVEAPMTTFYRLPEAGQPVHILTHLVIREDAHVLFGFATNEERTLFRLLIKVNGIGPKAALSILSGMEATQFVRAVSTQDISALTRIPGIGKKTAERIVIEMRDRLGVIPTALSDVPTRAEPRLDQKLSVFAEAESALLALGYKPVEASKALALIDMEGLRSEEVIRVALRSMVRPA